LHLQKNYIPETFSFKNPTQVEEKKQEKAFKNQELFNEIKGLILQSGLYDSSIFEGIA
jgi:hypothetical protein